MFGNISLMQKPYQDVIVEGKWESLEEFLDDDEAFSMAYPMMTVAKDTAFHIAVHSKSEQPLKSLLERVANYDEHIREDRDNVLNPTNAPETTDLHEAAINHVGDGYFTDGHMNFDHMIMITNLLNTTNAYENTVLHEAAINHNIEAVKLLVEGRPFTPVQRLSVEERCYVTPLQLLERNKSGQTPLFKAAAFGSTKVVKYLASQPNQMTYSDNGHKKLQDVHRINNDGFSILHAAIRGEHFGVQYSLYLYLINFFIFHKRTAIELLKLDQGLAELKTENGMTSLHLLTNLRSAFTNKFRDHLWPRLLYHCISTGDDNYDNADNIFEKMVDQNDGEVGGEVDQNDGKFGGKVDQNDGKVGGEQNDGKVGGEVDQNDGKVGGNQNPSPEWKIILETISKSANSLWNYFIKGRSFFFFFLNYLCTIFAVLETIYKLFWNLFIKDSLWPTAREIWVEKRKLHFAFKLARELIKNDHSWNQSYTQDTINDYRSSPSDKPRNKEPSSPTEEMPGPNIIVKEPSPITDLIIEIPMVEDVLEISIEEEPIIKVETPLLAATRRGVTELVKEILKKHPQAVEHVSHKKQNILHVAASYRRGDIFEHVKKMEIPTRRLIMGIDEKGYTVLHHVADTENYNGGTRSGPAYQFQEELEWFQRVEKIMPPYFTQHLENKTNKTAKELFREKHETQLKAAQQWIKETSQSCSGVAVLVATVVFAAAFTVPGGNDEKEGFPLLLHSPFFMSFTLTDVVSLSCSLTALVMFLSIITSPFEQDNFRVSLPRRLTLGFALLFVSVATTMLTFTSTIILIIQSEHRQQWTLTLMICCAAFVPVSVLALTHFPLFPSFIRAWNNILKFLWNALNACYSFLRPLGFCFLACYSFLSPLELCSLAFSCIFLWPLKLCFLACFQPFQVSSLSLSTSSTFKRPWKWGGSKRLQRRIDLKRSTPSIGIVQRVEYDPNRSSPIALVRWIEGVQCKIPYQRKEFSPPPKILEVEPTATTIRGLFSFSSLPQQRKVPCAKDVFFSALSSPKAKGETASLSFGSSCGFPRIAVAGAKPAFFAPRMREKVRGKNTVSHCEVQKWTTNSIHWAHRIKRKAALSWNSLGLVGAAKPKTDQGTLPVQKPIGQRPNDGARKVDRAPVSYVIL
ncbi:hypothetical protein EZV62_026213 [Acer yangbiense]|uniref:Large ribosomal subunit protein uL2 RNA-binding domain-containing protein n=1 Tax=Acer yangbiense TaxID=1000413 RepID=A0A5C7GQZ0_9ROSI|nr:hypothetical protein EZV62_026213 [Acer yangbiense]